MFRKLLTFVLFALASSCASDVETTRTMQPEKVSFHAHKPSRSFAFIRVDVLIVKEKCDEEGLCQSYEESAVSSTGSGSTITIRGDKYILTAAHVCMPSMFDSTVAFMHSLGFVTESLSAIGFYGNETSLKVVALDLESDICILEPQSVWVNPSLKLAKKLPRQGTKVHTVAAPFGLFEPGMVLAFEGYLAGLDSDGDVIVTFATRPGSSGAAILDSRGYIVGVVHSALPQFESLGIGTPIEKVHDLIEAMHKK